MPRTKDAVTVLRFPNGSGAESQYSDHEALQADARAPGRPALHISIVTVAKVQATVSDQNPEPAAV